MSTKPPPKETQFQSGQSGNPGGRPSNPFPALIRKSTKEGQEIVDKVLHLLRKSRSEKIQMWACEWLRDTGWGRPVQPLSNGDDDGKPFLVQIVKYEKEK